MMGLEKKYGVESFEKACEYVLRYETSYRYNTVSNVLKHKLYNQAELPFEKNTENITKHKNIRGGESFV